MRYILLFLLCLTFAQNASALCEQGSVQIVTKINKGTPVYDNTRSREEFSKLTNFSYNPNTVGLTHTILRHSLKLETKTKKSGKETCAVLKKVIFEFGYDKIPVYIDKKHKPGSCPYKVTKNHEDYHVAVSQQAMDFFEQDIKKHLKQVVRSVKSQPVTTNVQLQNWANEQQQKIMSGMTPVINHIQSKINEKNAAIDTPESYRKTTALCPNSNW